MTLLLESGTDNRFESGVGCAGISLGDGTTLRIDCIKSDGPDGILTATGGMGGAGIGRDSGPFAGKYRIGSTVSRCRYPRRQKSKPSRSRQTGSRRYPHARASVRESAGLWGRSRSWAVL